MNYVSLIEQALSGIEGNFTLAELLRRVDALDKSVPTIDELNAAFLEIQKKGQFPAYDWASVTLEAYNQAVAQNWKWMTQMLESDGISRERQQQLLAEHARIWGKHET
jgi:hypothetical protein